MVVITGCDENVDIEYYEFCIYTMNADGSDLTKVIDVGATYALFVPNSTMILYRSGKSLYTVNEDGSNNTLITDTLDVKSEPPVIFSDGSKVVFVSNNDIFIANINGDNITQLTGTKDIIERQPCLSLDNNEIIYNCECLKKSLYSICRMELYNGIIDTLLTSGNSLSWSKYSIDEEKIFYTKRGDNAGLFSMYKDGSNIIHLLSEIAVGFPIEVSSAKIVYFYTPNIYIVNYDGSAISDLGQGYDPHIALFNDSQIVYSNNGFQDGDIYIMNNDGTQKGRLASYGNNPRFSNDGTKIVFPGQYKTKKKVKNYITN